MKKIILSVFNILPVVAFILFWKRGLDLSFAMIPVWIIMSVINAFSAKKTGELILYNVILAMSSAVGIIIGGILYKLHYNDVKMEAIIQAEILALFLIIVFTTLIEIGIKKLIERLKKE